MKKNNSKHNFSIHDILAASIIFAILFMLLILILNPTSASENHVIPTYENKLTMAVYTPVPEETIPPIETNNREELTVIDTEEVEEKVKEDSITYIIQNGDSLWSISQKFYGIGEIYEKIAHDNGFTSNDVIYPGQEIIIKDINTDIALLKEEEKKLVTEIQNNKPQINNSNTPDTSNMTYLGNYRITGYDPYCAHCCGKTDGITASGRQAVYNYSVGCNNLPLGTELYIEGYGYYRVDDYGGSSTNLIDIAMSSHKACYTVTNYNVPVYRIN